MQNVPRSGSQSAYPKTWMNWYTGSIVSRMLKFGSPEPYQHDVSCFSYSKKMRRFFCPEDTAPTLKHHTGKGQPKTPSVDVETGFQLMLGPSRCTGKRHGMLGTWDDPKRPKLTRLCRHGEKTCFQWPKKRWLRSYMVILY